MFHVPEDMRLIQGNMASSSLDGNNGVFLIPCGSDLIQCIASDGLGWEHVSVTVRTKNRNRYEVPTWNTMCWMKEIFWDDEDVVVQYHPAKSEYVNNHEFVLHLWRPTNQVLPKPDSILVGVKQ